MGVKNGVADDAEIAGFESPLTLYVYNIYFGSFCLVFVSINFLILCSTKRFRKQYQILIALNLSHFVMLWGIILEATERRALFMYITETRRVPTKNSRDCLLPWIILQTIADFWGPFIEFTMGLERFCAVMYPTLFFKLFSDSPTRSTVIATVVAAICVLVPIGISGIAPTPNVRYSCGRKAAFSTAFGTVDYATNVVFYSASFVFNIIATVKASYLRQSQKHMQKLQCYTGISFLSTVLISIPNLLSIINANFVKLPDAVMTPAVIMACANCALSFFVYLILNPEFRRRLLHIFTMGKLNTCKVSAPIVVSQIHGLPPLKTPVMTKIVYRSA